MSDDDLRNFAPSRVGTPASGPQGQVTAALPIGTLRVPLSLYEQIKEAVRAIDPWHSTGNRRSYQNKAGYIALLTRGLHQLTLGATAMKLAESSRAIRRLLEGAESIDLEPRTCPRAVDPRWWAEQEAERIQQGVEEIRRAVGEALRISRGVADVERELATKAV